MERTRNVLYRVFSDDGELLYVGATTAIGKRMGEHSKHTPWWDLATEIKLERFGTVEELAVAEIDAIKSEDPRYNVIHTDKPRTSMLGPRGKPGEGSLYKRTDGMWIGALSYTIDGQRRRQTVSSKSKAEAARKLALLKDEVGLKLGLKD